MNSLFEFPSFTFVILRLENIQLTRVARELELHTFFFCGECLFLLNLWPRIRMQILKTDVPEKSNRFLASSSIPFFVFFSSFSFFPLLSNRGTQIKRFFRINEKRKMEIRAVFSSSFMISSFVFLSLSHYKYSFFPAFLVMKQYNTYLYLRFFKNKSYQRNKNVIFEYKPVLVIRKKLLYLYKIMSLTWTNLSCVSYNYFESKEELLSQTEEFYLANHFGLYINYALFFNISIFCSNIVKLNFYHISNMKYIQCSIKYKFIRCT